MSLTLKKDPYKVNFSIICSLDFRLSHKRSRVTDGLFMDQGFPCYFCDWVDNWFTVFIVFVYFSCERDRGTFHSDLQEDRKTALLHLDDSRYGSESSVRVMDDLSSSSDTHGPVASCEARIGCRSDSVSSSSRILV